MKTIFRAALQIIVQNTSTGEYLTDKDHALQTSKADTSQHGFWTTQCAKNCRSCKWDYRHHKKFHFFLCDYFNPGEIGERI